MCLGAGLSAASSNEAAQHPADTSLFDKLLLDVSDTRQKSGLAAKVESPEPTQDQGSNSADVSNPVLVKTKLCKFFAKGECTKGEACTYAHGRAQLKAQPDFWRTQLCFDFVKTGACSYGAGCRYAHSLEDLRPLDRSKAERATEKRRNRRIQNHAVPGKSFDGQADGSSLTEEKRELLSKELQMLKEQTAWLEAQLSTLMAKKAEEDVEERSSTLFETGSSGGQESSPRSSAFDMDATVSSPGIAEKKKKKTTAKEQKAVNAGIYVKNTFIDISDPEELPARRRGHSAPPSGRA